MEYVQILINKFVAWEHFPCTCYSIQKACDIDCMITIPLPPPFPLIFFPKINGKGGENLESLKKYLPHWLHLKDFSPSVGSHIYLWNRNISFFSNSVQRSWIYPLILTLQIRVASMAPGFEPTPPLTLQIRGWANLSLAREYPHPALH